ncbi:MAG TPA: hypothetical protein VMU87_18575 [Stellaceae bacterium]|nr:hypothetical protein [Stellaceae bacterium]
MGPVALRLVNRSVRAYAGCAMIRRRHGNPIATSWLRRPPSPPPRPPTNAIALNPVVNGPAATLDGVVASTRARPSTIEPGAAPVSLLRGNLLQTAPSLPVAAASPRAMFQGLINTTGMVAVTTAVEAGDTIILPATGGGK